jgi:uncharacterized protein
MAFRFLSKLFPQEFNFYELFEKQVKVAVEAADVFKAMATNGLDDSHVTAIRALEHAGDEAAHTILEQLDKTFITPFDREDIHALANELDDVIDQIDTIVNRMRVYRLTGVNKDLQEFSGVIEDAVSALARAVNGMRNMKNDHLSIENACVEVNRLENVSDVLRDNALANLFDTEKDAIAVIKWKEIFQDAEKVLDQCEDVAHIVRSIVLKQA